ncbi:alpha-2-macroglobulin family protein [Calycomorphotria hydatis]|uniref:MG2 domain protein n=1 Tax=Calycomorphotria hydatis TaxID=2528027 RepID=A0A517T8E4_9PLAN|nr:MG2 domain-containing protein [Calycomorphotria hydatis]QDT64656.1 MG2 domain protein [Calycomorphotria hydatis]
MSAARSALSVSFLIVCFAFCLFTMRTADSAKPEDAQQQLREEAAKSFKDGNWKEAFDKYEQLTTSQDNSGKQLANEFENAIRCLRQLGRQADVDEYREKVIAAHAGEPHLLQEAANSLLNGMHYGYLIGEEFHRGYRDARGEWVEATERDRVRALQLLLQGAPHVEKLETKAAQQNYFYTAEQALLNGRSGYMAWKLQELTDLSELPDFLRQQNRRWGWNPSPNRGAPVDADGNPVYHHLPEHWEEAKSDGERYRWVLEKQKQVYPEMADAVDYRFADFLRSQFGVPTIRSWEGYARLIERTDASANGDEADSSKAANKYALHTLSDDETIAKLANGVQRFTLPDEFNFMLIYKRLAEGNSYASSAMERLAHVYLDRRQFPRAADQWRQTIDRFGKGGTGYRQKQLDQIVGNWCMFENVQLQSAGQPAKIDLRFRNGKDLQLKAYRIKIEELIQDVKAYLKSAPRNVDWNKINIDRIGYRLVYENEKKYRGAVEAEWEVKLNPRDGHVDTRKTIDTPLKESGAYLVEGTIDGGNTSRIVLWLADTAIVKKQLNNEVMYFVADALTGEPISRVNVEFFGWRWDRRNSGRNVVSTDNFAERTDADGMIMLDQNRQSNRYQWLTIARTTNGRFGFLGFSGVWYGRMHQAEYQQNKAILITDRPVYRPDQTVKYKFWVRRADYSLGDDVSTFAGQSFTVRMTDPKGEQVLEKTFQADEYGGFEGEWVAPLDATLGSYRLHIINRGDVHGGGSFRLEEYKKPEFEVTVDAPSEPVKLGEEITATIRANYYFGSPVTEAKVRYTVKREDYDTVWYPPMPWDWFYGNGYWWFAPDYAWYPGWGEWGCRAPRPTWWWAPQNPPELVAEDEVEIGPDGTVEVKIDTSIAAALFDDRDHKYVITAEVTDASRRTITGSGSVLAPRKPFEVFAWVDRGFFRTGDTVTAHFKAQTADRNPVQGSGKLTLLKVTHDEEGNITEEEVESWDLATGEDGTSSQQFVTANAGQFRLKYVVTSKAGETVEGGYVFNVLGEDTDAEYRFQDLELLVDQREYQPGDTAKLLVGTQRKDSTVLVFVRPTNNVYPKPQLLQLTGNSSVVDVAINKKDMPNIFVEVMSVSDGKVHVVAKEFFIPPEKRVLNVEIEPSSDAYLPGEDATVKVRVTGENGEPVTGSLAMTIYDQSVDYISGGTNVPEIREHFWKWRRSHQPRTEHNLNRWSSQLLKRGEQGMGYLGAFGDIAEKEFADRGGNELLQSRSENRALRKSSFEAVAGGLALPQSAPLAASAVADEADFAFEAKGEAQNGRRREIGKDKAGGGGGGEAPLAEATVRKEFADTAYWNGSITLDQGGEATIELKMPENLTGWKIATWAMSHGTRVGAGEAKVVTRKNVLVRLQAPRFFTETDEVVLSANVHNYLDEAKLATVLLELGGDTLAAVDSLSHQVEVPAQGEVRVDWLVRAVAPGEATVTMKALTDTESDAMQMTFPVQEHGSERMESFTGIMREGDESNLVNFSIPEKRRPEDTRIQVRFSPSLASAMVDALPYLAAYPYGCTEQTLNRFLPTVLTQRILQRMDVDLEEVRNKTTNLNAQELGDPEERAKRWKQRRWGPEQNPVFDAGEVENMVKAGVTRLTNMQSSDGGWGWFGGSHRSSPHLTAIVVHGLHLAQENDVAIVPGVLDSGVNWLKKYQAEQLQLLKAGEQDPKPQRYKLHADNLDAFVQMVLVENGQPSEEMSTYLYRDRLKLSVYALSMFGLTLYEQQATERLAMVRKNIEQYLVVDDENSTAYLRLPNSGWWYWYGSDIEANSYYLKLLNKVDPHSDIAPRLVKYILNNRKHATYWNSTRDTAVAIEALAEYVTASGESSPDLTVEVWFDGVKEKEVHVTSENLFTFDNTFEIFGSAVDAGEHTIELKRKGRGPLYWNTYVTTFNKEDFIPKAGLEIKVERRAYKLTAKDQTTSVRGSSGQAIDQKIEAFDREELSNDSELVSGDLVEIELIIESKNDYEYLAFEDMKAAGFEPVDVRSGYTGNSLRAYQEMRDNRVVFFIERLPRGRHSVKYRTRAEVPGRFSALPTKAFAMYAPELKANSDEWKIAIADE